ncbi:MAG: hypothetical protein DRJ40_02325 [Thermoprotei archaeon]|nr:MAG: hypothetical protein DRJ40_02325 [Thermoprotei archaeon]
MSEKELVRLVELVLKLIEVRRKRTKQLPESGLKLVERIVTTEVTDPLMEVLDRVGVVTVREAIERQLTTYSQIIERERQGIIRVVRVGEQAYIVSTELLNRVLQKLSQNPLSEDELRSLPEKEQNVIRVLALAGYLYQDKDGRYRPLLTP